MNVGLPEIFNDFSEARQKGFMDIKRLKEQGKKIVGTYCAFTPDELIYAAGAVPVSLCGMSEEPIAEAERDLPRNLCPLIKSSYGFGITDTCPYFYFADLLVGETTCDGKKKMYEYLGKVKPMHVMELPQSNSPENVIKWTTEMSRLKDRLEDIFNTTITEAQLSEAIRVYNRKRQSMQALYSLSQQIPPPLKGLDMLHVLYGTGFKVDKNGLAVELDALTRQIQQAYDEGERPVSVDAPRILITGCPMGGDSMKVARILEENGAVVVAFENCSGTKPQIELVDENKPPLEALAEKYLNICCSVLSPNTKRLDLLGQLIDKFQVEGVVDMTLQACHTYNVESLSVKRFVREQKNVPYIQVETDYSPSDMGQLKTRLSAFIEML